MVNMIVNSAVILLKFAEPQNLSPYAKFMQHFPLLIVKISDKSSHHKINRKLIVPGKEKFGFSTKGQQVRYIINKRLNYKLYPLNLVKI